jgi:hypothetical protein
MSWRIEDDQLMLRSATVGGAEQKYTLYWLGEKKLKLQTEGDVTKLVRVGDRSTGGNPLVGEWVESREMDGRNWTPAGWFTPGGKLLFVMPFAIQHGSCTSPTPRFPWRKLCP